MSDRRDYPRDVQIDEVRIADPHPAGPARRADQRLYTETASTEFSGSATADVAPGVDPYRPEPLKKNKGGAMVRVAIMALLLGAGAVTFAQFANEPAATTEAPVVAQDPRFEVPLAAPVPEAAPAVVPAAEPAPAPRPAPVRARRAPPAPVEATPEPTPTPIEPTPEQSMTALTPIEPAPTPIDPATF